MANNDDIFSSNREHILSMRNMDFQNNHDAIEVDVKAKALVIMQKF
jgi:hypothetical protein